MPDDDATPQEQTAPEVDAVIVVPVESEPGPSIDQRLSVIEARLTDIASSLSAHMSQHEDTTDDGDDRTDGDAGDNRAEEEAGETAQERNERPITRHWLFGKLGG